jgi:hypothetical protein
MSTKKPHEGLPPDSPSDVRPLPARPNLEFERKQAKKLAAQLRRGSAEALARVRAKLKHVVDGGVRPRRRRPAATALERPVRCRLGAG